MLTCAVLMVMVVSACITLKAVALRDAARERSNALCRRAGVSGTIPEREKAWVRHFRVCIRQTVDWDIPDG